MQPFRTFFTKHNSLVLYILIVHSFLLLSSVPWYDNEERVLKLL